jgi:hypothetical protein
MTSAHAPTDKAIRRDSDKFASYNPITGRDANGRKAPDQLPTRRAKADAYVRRKAGLSDAELRAFMEHRNAQSRARRKRKRELKAAA